jgi:hypothetical protein
VQRAPALRLAQAALAGVFSFEARLTAAERPENGLGDVVPALLALAVMARQGEQRRRVLDLDAANVRRFRHGASTVLFFDLEAKRLELGDFSLEARCFVFTATPFAGALSSFPESSMVHEVPGRMS